MKKIFVLIIAVIFSSCLGTKKVSDYTKITKQTEKTAIKKDSSNVTSTNKAIDDYLVTPVPSTNNPELDILLDNFLLKLNTSKKSGDNSYKQTYNPEKRQIETNFTIGETKDSETNTNSEKNTEKSFTQQIDEYIYKKIIALPWWAYGAIAFLLRNQLIGLLSFFIPGLKTIKTIGDLKKKLTPKIRSPV